MQSDESICRAERWILYINAYIWNLDGTNGWFYMQGGKGDTDVKNRRLDSVEKGEGGMIWENSIKIYTLPCVKMSSMFDVHAWSRAPKAGALWQPRGIGWGGLCEGGSGCGGNMYTYGKFMLMCGKNHHNIVIILKINEFFKWE